MNFLGTKTTQNNGFQNLTAHLSTLFVAATNFTCGASLHIILDVCLSAVSPVYVPRFGHGPGFKLVYCSSQVQTLLYLPLMIGNLQEFGSGKRQKSTI